MSLDLTGLTPTQLRFAQRIAKGNLLWTPHPDNIPQMQAYISEANVLYYGGAAGGGKSDLLLGLGLTDHKKSIIFRREYPQLRDLIDRSSEILSSTKAKFNQTANRWSKVPGGASLEFGAVQYEKDKEKYKGRPHDFKGFDEVSDFSETQFRFLIAWNRSTTPGQRCRVVCAGNPPTHAEGEWVIRYWAPWLSKYHPNPAKPGELRWFMTIKGKDVEVKNSDPVDFEGESIQPLSRTFIPARLSDNPYFIGSGYRATLQSLPEPLRSQLLLGLFSIETPDTPRQVIPTAWVRAAQDRWRDREAPMAPLTSVGVDPSRGGADDTAIARRAGNYYYEVQVQPGAAIPDGPACAAFVIECLEDDLDVEINVDVIGIGASVYDSLKGAGLQAVPVNFGAGTPATDSTGQLAFSNVRAEAYWTFREALDPNSGQDIALPLDEELIAELVAPRWDMSSRGIRVEKKKDIRKRLTRSPNKADAVVLANYEMAMGVMFR